MYAVHFLLFVTTLILCHIIQSCLKPYAKHEETDQPPEEPPAEEANRKEDEENCVWSPWSAWSECTVTCGDGISVRHRITLILGNCTGDMIQEKICSEQHCSHDKEFIFQRKDEDADQSSRNDEDIQGPEDAEQNHRYEQSQSDGKIESPDANEIPVSPGGHVTGFRNTPDDNVNAENDAHFDEKNEEGEDDARGRPRGQSWTSDDGNTWGGQSSFESMSPGEGPEEDGFRSGEEEKREDVDKNCVSDCSPTDPPPDSFGSEKSRTEEGAQDKAGSGQDDEKTRSGRGGEGQEEKFGKGNSESFKDRQKSKADERSKDKGKVSNDEENRHEVDTDLDDDDNFDDEMDDADDYDDDDDNDKDEGGAGKKQKREHEEEDAEQDDLEQDEEEQEMEKKRRRKRKRKRRRKKKSKEDGVKSNDSQVVCDPTEIADTFLAQIESPNSVDEPVLVVSEIEKCDSASNMTAETNVSSTNRSELEVLEIDEFGCNKKLTSDLSESEICDVAERL